MQQLSTPQTAEILHTHPMKAGLQVGPYVPSMTSDAMLPWLAQAAQEARLAQRRKQVHVAASLDRDQSTVARFEKGRGWPQNPDQMVGAYADDLDISPIDIWRRAMDLWTAAEQP